MQVLALQVQVAKIALPIWVSVDFCQDASGVCFTPYNLHCSKNSKNLSCIGCRITLLTDLKSRLLRDRL
jgi:hypothetical protein